MQGRFGDQTGVDWDIEDLKTWLKPMPIGTNGSPFCAVLWWIWRSRNIEVFDQEALSMEVIWRNICFKAAIFGLNIVERSQHHVTLRLVWWE